MNTRYISKAIPTLLLLGNVYAATVAVSPIDQTVTLGVGAEISVEASGFVAGGSPSLGTYDVTVTFDPSILSPTVITWGNGLDVLGLGDVQSSTTGSGSVNVFELSLDSSTDLNSLQPDTFTLFTATFTTLAPGRTSVSVHLNALGDADGNSIHATIQSGFVNISSAPTGIPESSPAMQVMTGLAMVALCSAYARSRRFWHVMSSMPAGDKARMELSTRSATRAAGYRQQTK